MNPTSMAPSYLSSFPPPTSNLTLIRYPSPIQWLADRLAAAISVLHPSPPIIQLPPFSLNPNQLGTLASPIPLKLAAQEKRSPQEIGAQLIEHIGQPNPWLNPKLWMHPAGWLYASFSDADLAEWLQTLQCATPTLLCASGHLQRPAIGISKHPTLFQLQYAHARCCSLLRLAHQEKLTHLTDADPKLAQFTVPIAWQNNQGELLLQTPAEQRILIALMQFPNTLSSTKQIYGESHSSSPGQQTQIEWPSSDIHLHRQAHQWSTLFLDFYGECRILGDLQSTAPELLQARLALILILQRVLAFYLEAVLQIEAPVIL